MSTVAQGWSQHPSHRAPTPHPAALTPMPALSGHHVHTSFHFIHLGLTPVISPYPVSPLTHKIPFPGSDFTNGSHHIQVIVRILTPSTSLCKLSNKCTFAGISLQRGSNVMFETSLQLGPLWVAVSPTASVVCPGRVRWFFLGNSDLSRQWVIFNILLNYLVSPGFLSAF